MLFVMCIVVNKSYLYIYFDFSRQFFFFLYNSGCPGASSVVLDLEVTENPLSLSLSPECHHTQLLLYLTALSTNRCFPR